MLKIIWRILVCLIHLFHIIIHLVIAIVLPIITFLWDFKLGFSTWKEIIEWEYYDEWDWPDESEGPRQKIYYYKNPWDTLLGNHKTKY